MYRHNKLIEIIQASDLNADDKKLAVTDIKMMVVAGKIKQEKYDKKNPEVPEDLLGSLFSWRESELGEAFWERLYVLLAVYEYQEG
jgi:hypothetical protein